MIGRALRELWAHLLCARDPIGYHRSRGVRIGDRVDLIARGIHTFGSEPYLVAIGHDVTISHGVDFITHDGALRVIRDRHPDAFYYAPITVHDRAFIGARAIILPGVTIGEASVVGAGAVVASDVPAGIIVGGVPARPIKAVEDYAFARRDEWIDTSGLDHAAKRSLLSRRFAQW